MKADLHKFGSIKVNLSKNENLQISHIWSLILRRGHRPSLSGKLAMQCSAVASQYQEKSKLKISKT